MSNVLPHHPELDTEREAAGLAFAADQPALRRLREIAIEQEWENSQRPARPVQVLSSSAHRPVSQKSGGDNPWFRVSLNGPDHTFATVDVQPMFDLHIQPSKVSPVFVRVLRHDGTCSTGLHAITTSDTDGMILEHYTLPNDLSPEYPGVVEEEFSVDITPTLGALAADRMTSTLDTLHQHLPSTSVLSGLGSMPLRESVYSD